MAAGEHPLVLVEQSTVPVVSDAADASSKTDVLPALFLRPRAGDDGAALPAPPGDGGPVPGCPSGIKAEFRGWAGVPRRWPEWVAKLRQRHEPLWRELGIRDGILASTFSVRRSEHEHALLPLAAFWCAATGTFVFPWGEATLTLEDIHTLAGLPLLGVPVRAPVSDSDRLVKDVAAIEAVRAVMNQSKNKKPAYSVWVKRFLERTAEEEAPPSAAGGADGDGEARELLEHGAFLAMWLSLYVLPGPPFDIVRREVLPLAARLASGESVALAPAALATIYHDLSELKRHMTSDKKDEPFVVSAPMHILVLWVWEHFTQVNPEPAASSTTPYDHDMPRAARWHKVGKRLSSKDVHAVFMSPKEFKWRPYGNRSLFGLQPENGGFWSSATSEVRSSLVRCLHACELMGMNCIQQYSPHRVARQLGFDQDIPGTVPRASSSWEKAWETYNIEAESSALIFPTNHKPGVTIEYAKWWKPYSSATEMKEGHDFVGPVKRKMEGVLGGKSSKKLSLPVVCDLETNVYPSQSSGSHAAMTRAAAAPAISATRTSQPAPDAGDDPLDHISLSERLNNITKMPKQPNTECLVKGGEQETAAVEIDEQMVSKTNDEQDNHVMKEGTVQNSCDCQFAIVQDDITPRRQSDVLTHAATVQTYDALLQGPTEKLDTCIGTGDIENTDKVPNENGGSLNFNEKGKEDILLSNEELEHPMEHSAGASRKKSGNNEIFSSRLLDGNTKLDSHEVCTKTLYYLSRFDRMKDAWDKDANNLPRREVGTMETIKRASAIRQAEMAELGKKINTLKEEILALEAAEKGKSPE